ncbi:MAG: type II secretion system F family protein [Thiobacillaceae bacterium]
MRYQVKAIDRQQCVVSLTLEALDEEDARNQVTSQGATLLSVRPQGFSLAGLTSGTRFSLTLFSQELMALLDAGLSLVESIETLADKAERSDARSLLEQITHHLYEGKTFSQALQPFPSLFPPLYIATIRAAERTGALSPALKRFLDYREQMDVVRRKIVSASIYPLLLLAAGGLVTAFLLGFVVPRFAQVYEDTGRQMPWLSQLLLSWGRLIAEHGLWILAIIGLLVAATVYLYRLPAFSRRRSELLWRFPVVGERFKLYQLARFYRTTGMLLSGGMPIMTSLNMAKDLLPGALALQLEQASEDVRTGKPISWAMDKRGLTTPVALRMLRVGEKTGHMDQMMERIAAFYDDDMARWVDWFTRLFEPVLMAVIGLVIGGIVVLMYMPVFDLAGSLQ